MYDENDFYDDEGNFVIPRRFNFEDISDFDIEFPVGWVDFYYNNPPADKKLLKKLKKDVKEILQSLRDLGMFTDYDLDQNQRIVALNRDYVDDEQVKDLIRSQIESLNFSLDVIEKIEKKIKYGSPKKNFKKKNIKK